LSTSVFVCESQPIVVEGLRSVFAADPGLTFAGTRPNLPEALDEIRGCRPDIVLVDQNQGFKAAIQFVGDVKTVSPDSRAILWVHELAEAECFRVLQMGARGVVRRSMPVSALLDCIHAVASGSVWVENGIPPQLSAFHRHGAPRLTSRERDIVRCVCQGLKNKEIARALSITPGTVKVHLMHIFEKTGVKDRFELAMQGRQLIPGEECVLAG
jgi:DNA-binding NarL/FixJ family response regulator